jgi:hypothetical protein
MVVINSSIPFLVSPICNLLTSIWALPKGLFATVDRCYRRERSIRITAALVPWIILRLDWKPIHGTILGAGICRIASGLSAIAPFSRGDGVIRCLVAVGRICILEARAGDHGRGNMSHRTRWVAVSRISAFVILSNAVWSRPIPTSILVISAPI